MLQITKMQFINHMKLKKKEEQSVGASVLPRRGTKYSQEQIWRQSVEQTERKAIQSLPYLGIHPVHIHQNQTLLGMPTSACCKEPDIAVS